MNRILDFLALKRSFAGVLLVVVLVGLGEKISDRYLPIYLLALGGGNLAIGILNGAANALNALASWPAGLLSDRIGHRKTLAFFSLLAMVGYAIAIVSAHWIGVLFGAALFLTWSAVSLPAAMSVIAEALPKNKQTMGVTMHSLVRRIPMALGPLIGGALIGSYGSTEGMRIGFGIALILAGISLLIQLLSPEEPRARRPPEGPSLKFFQAFNRPLRSLLVSDILIRFCEHIPYAFVVVWAMKIVGISAFEFGILTAIEMTTATVIYLPVAPIADAGRKRPFVLATFAIFTAFPLVLLFSRSYPMLVIAFIVRGLKEFGEPSRKSLILDLAPGGSKAGVFGLYYLIRDSIVAVAALGGALLWDRSPQTNLVTAFACGAVGTLYYALFSRKDS